MHRVSSPSLPSGAERVGRGGGLRSEATQGMFVLRHNALAMPADGPADVGEVSLRKGAGSGLKG